MDVSQTRWFGGKRSTSASDTNRMWSLFGCRCKVCPLTFFSKSDMQIHSKTHTEAKAHKCPHCTKTFVNASYLAQHLRIHLGIKPYRCSYCERCFRQLSHLQQHTRSGRSDSPGSSHRAGSQGLMCVGVIVCEEWIGMSAGCQIPESRFPTFEGRCVRPGPVQDVFLSQWILVLNLTMWLILLG